MYTSDLLSVIYEKRWVFEAMQMKETKTNIASVHIAQD
jgi:hypothetical protein